MKGLLKNRPVCALLVLQAAVYLSFLAADLFFAGLGLFSAFAKYLGILLCLAMAVLLHRGAWDRWDSALLLCALALTCAADLFLLLLGLAVPGLLAFCLSHLFYIRRYRAGIFPAVAAMALGVMLVSLAAQLLIPGFPAYFVLAGLYAALILTVTVCGWLSKLPQTNRRLVNAGMALFLLCDVHVALFNVLPAESPYFPFAAFFMWFFYLPAQVALALSGYDYRDVN